jgi:hypothetical protein
VRDEYFIRPKHRDQYSRSPSSQSVCESRGSAITCQHVNFDMVDVNIPVSWEAVTLLPDCVITSV